MNNTPLFFIHKGAHSYLRNALRQACYFNPDSPVYLLGDDKNKSWFKDKISHFDIKDYEKESDEFAREYVHMSSMYQEYEMFCIQRWFIIRSFVEKHNIDKFICLDSDVLLYANLSEELTGDLHANFAVCADLPIVWNLEKIQSFTDYIRLLYKSQNIGRLSAIYKTYFNKDNQRVRMGGINDIALVRLWLETFKEKILDLNIPHGGVSFDGSMRSSYGFAMKDGLKEIIWKNDRPYGKYVKDGGEELVRFLCLHFQGRSKMKQHYYLLDGKGKHPASVPLLFRLEMMKAWGSKMVSGMKKFDFMVQLFWNTYKVKRRF